MGIFNRDYRCFDNDSIDTAAMFESIWESAHADDSSIFSSSNDPWMIDSSSSDCSSLWRSSDD